MDEREDELARLLEHARAEAPSASVLSDVRESLLSSASEAAASSAGAASTASPAAPTAALKLALPLKLVVGALAVGAAIAVISASFETRAPVPRAVPALPAPAAEPAPKALAPAVIEPAPAPAPASDAPGLEPPLAEKPPKRLRSKVASAPVTAEVEAAPTSAAFAEELGLIKAALEAQRAGRMDEARAKLEEHARRFPKGQLTHERERIAARLSQ